MPNRLIRESIRESDSVDALNPQAEITFYRLITYADDFGRFPANTRLLRAQLYPLKDKLKLSQIEKDIKELCTAGIIVLYQAGEKKYGVFLNWEKYQTVRIKRSKYPEPPEEILSIKENEYPLEKDIEYLIYKNILKSRIFFGYDVITIDRQARIKNAYLDLLIKSLDYTFILEIKRDRLSNKSIKQIMRYGELISGNALLIGAGVSGNFNFKLCKENNIGVLTYNSQFEISLLLESKVFLKDECDITLNHTTSHKNTVISRQTALVSESNPNPIRIQSESNPKKAFNKLKAPVSGGHFSKQVDNYAEPIIKTCKKILKLPQKNGKPFNPFQWVQSQTNNNMHPGAILESIEALQKYWKDIRDGPWAYANSVIKTKNGNWNERSHIAEAEKFKTTWISPEVKELITNIGS